MVGKTFCAHGADRIKKLLWITNPGKGRNRRPGGIRINRFVRRVKDGNVGGDNKFLFGGGATNNNDRIGPAQCATPFAQGARRQQKSVAKSDFFIKNQNGNIAYRVIGKPSLTKTLKIENAKGKPIGSIHKKMIALLPTFEMFESGKKIGEIRKEVSLFRPKLSVSYEGWKVEGDFFNWNYIVKNDKGQTIAKIDKELWHMTDHYAIHYEDDQDSLVLLMIVLAIDAIREEESAVTTNAANASSNNQ